MYIPFGTEMIWEVDGDFPAEEFFQALPDICAFGDTLVIGSYEAAERARTWLLEHSAPERASEGPYYHTFALNRREHPLGRAYEITLEPDKLAMLAELSLDPCGSTDKPLFFDHVLVYRNSVPVIPLLDFHDAFTGGTMFLSPYYSEAEVKRFTERLGATAKYIPLPYHWKSSSPQGN